METPSFMATTYGSSAVNSLIAPFAAVADAMPYRSEKPEWNKLAAVLGAQVQKAQAVAPQVQPQPKQEIPQVNKKRLVRVVMVDAHKDVPPEISLIYDSKEVFTDKTDQELYFDIPVAALLKEHNEKRTKIVNKDVKDRTEYLEAARISNLQMLVITLAQF